MAIYLLYLFDGFSMVSPQQESRDLMLNCPQNHILSNAQTQKQIVYRSLPILHADDGVPQ